MTATSTSPALKAAMRRSAQFLRPPAELPGPRAVHHLHLASLIERAMGHAILAGQNDIAMKLSALRNDAEVAFGADVAAAEMAYLDAEIAECGQLLAELVIAKRVRRKRQQSGSPGQRARAAARKRGALTFKM
jgi:hypothetical protein